MRHKFNVQLTVPAMLVAVLLIAGSSVVLAAGSSVYLPIVFGHPYVVNTICDPNKPLLDTDVGSIDAMLTPDGDWVVAIQDRSHGSRIRVMHHVGDHLEDLPGVAITAAMTDTFGLTPAFSPPGPKQGDMALVVDPHGAGHSRMYFTQRALDADPDVGPYAPHCMPV